MIVYPLENYSTFINVADATAKLTELGAGDEWAFKSVTEQEVMLAVSTQIIKSLCDIIEGGCLYAEAQVMIIQSDMANNGKYLTSVDTTQPYKKAKIGSLNVEYNLVDIEHLPSLVKSMLSGCLKVSDSPRAIGFTLA